MQVISSYAREHSITVVLVTHDDDLAAKFSDRVLHIHDGRFPDSDGEALAAGIDSEGDRS